MSRAPSEESRSRSRRRSGWLLVLAVAFLVGATAATALERGHSPPAPPPPVVPGTLAVASSVRLGVLAPAFWGANTLSGVEYGPPQAAQFRATPIEFALWPGGTGGDDLNMTSNVLYHDDGGGYQPATNEGAFVAWCRDVGCRAIFQLPAEIDDPATAAYEVAYTERTLGFHPDYWEIGNEPALWKHFGIPWSQWSGNQHQNATPLAYAGVVHAYALAVRAVDPAARLLGLAGVGTGSQGEAQWIRVSATVNAGLLSGVAIHVYPAGVAASGGGSLSAFLSSLRGGGSLAARVPADRAALAHACAACAHLPIFVTELGSATVAPAYAGYMQGFPQVPFLAAEMAQAMALNVTNLDVYSLQSDTYPGALFDGHGLPHPAARLYSEIFPYLGRGIALAQLSVPVGGVFGVATVSTVSGLPTALVANTNITDAVRLNLSFSPAPVAATRVALVWSGATSGPVFANGTSSGSVVLTLPPVSVGLVAYEPAVLAPRLAIWTGMALGSGPGAKPLAVDGLGVGWVASATAMTPWEARAARRGARAPPSGTRRPTGRSSASMGLRVILFDIGGVLLRYRDEWLFESLARRMRLPVGEVGETLRVLRTELHAGRIDEPTLWLRFARAFRISPPENENGLWSAELRRRGRPNIGTVALAEELRSAGLRVGILSNTDASHVAYFRKRGWFAGFRPWILSHELGAVKPETAAFRRAARRVGLPPGRILLVDDALANVQAARSLGWDAVRFTRAGNLRRELARRGIGAPRRPPRADSGSPRASGPDANDS